MSLVHGPHGPNQAFPGEDESISPRHLKNHRTAVTGLNLAPRVSHTSGGNKPLAIAILHLRECAVDNEHTPVLLERAVECAEFALLLNFYSTF